MQIAFFLLLVGNSRMVQCRGGEMLSIVEYIHPRASGSGSFLLAVIYTGTTKMPHFVIFEATFSKFSGN